MANLTAIGAYDLVYGDPDGHSVKMRVRFRELPDVIPFVAHSNDREPHGRELYADAVAGRYGPVAPYPISAEQQLADAKARICVGIDTQAETIRATYLTAGTGQAMVYQEKGEQAIAALNEENPDPDDYPLLKATLGIEGNSIHEVARLVVETKAQWTAVAAAVEEARLGGKANVNASSSVSQAKSIATGISWPKKYGD